MRDGSFRFANFRLDCGERLLTRGGERVELSGRYLDALALMLRGRGSLITKDRFMTEVWNGVPVTDEALTQCIRTLRRQLGDDAVAPRFIETVPKHGYRFIGEVEESGTATAVEADPRRSVIETLVAASAPAGIAGALAGLGGGLFYGLAASPSGPAEGLGVVSMLLVMVVLSMLVGLLAGLGVGVGIAAASLAPDRRWQWTVGGGMIGGFVIGGIVKLIGLDAFALLVGHAPKTMTGPAEGALLGAAVGLGIWFAAAQRLPVGRSALVGAATSGAAGLLIPLLGGHLLGGTLSQFARDFPHSRFRLDAIGGYVGETGFGRVSEVVTSSMEGALFGLCIAAAFALARRRTGP